MRRLASRVLVVALLAGLLGAVPASGALAEDTPVVALPFQSTDWAYEQVASGGGPDKWETPDFGDSAWARGQAGFGTTDGVCPWNNPDQVHTAWSPQTDMLLRHRFSLPVGATGVHISGTVDNDADIYVNGKLVRQAKGGFCNADTISVYLSSDEAAGANIGQDNLVAIRARDYGEATFIDVQIDFIPSTVIRAGDFNRVDGWEVPLGEPDAPNCTSGFAVVRGTTRYMLTADHCRWWFYSKSGDKGGDSSHVTISGPLPPAILAGPDSEWSAYAAYLDCSRQASVQTHLCLRAGLSKYPSDSDVMAWRPDPGTVTPTGELQTDHGVFPVLGNGDWKPSQQICQVGSETGREKCGSILQKSAFVKNTSDKNYGRVAWRYPDTSQHIMPGDSGGPVYAYMYNPDGSINGVSALGINEAYNCNKQKTICTNYFLPIATIMNVLQVTVLNTP